MGKARARAAILTALLCRDRVCEGTVCALAPLRHLRVIVQQCVMIVCRQVWHAECGLGKAACVHAMSTADGYFVHVYICCGSCGCAGDEHGRDEWALRRRHYCTRVTRCLSTPDSHVIDQFLGLEVGLVVVLNAELGPGQPGEL